MDKKIEKKKWPPKKIILTSLGILFVSFILYTIIFGDHSSKLNVNRERITVSEVEFGPFIEFIPPNGEIQPRQTFYLDVTEGGRIIKKFVEEGAFLNVGDPIVQLENSDMTLRVMYNEAQLFQQMNSLRSTKLQMEQNRLQLKRQMLNQKYEMIKEKRRYENNKKLYKKELVSRIEFEESRDNFELLESMNELIIKTSLQDSIFRTEQVKQLELGVKRMQANLDMIKAQMQKLTVRAPISGQLTALNAEIGQSINKGQNLGRIDDIDDYKIRVEIDEHYLPKIRKGLMGEFPYADSNYRVQINTVYVQVIDGRFAVDMFFVDEVPAGIRRGQTVRIKLELGDLTDATIVDRGGFYQSTGGQWAFVLKEDEKTATKQSIILGRQNSLVFEVLDGLKPGDKVITSSYDNFGDVEKLILE